MSKFTKITRVIAGVTLVTAATVGCSDDATNPNIINSGITHTRSIVNQQEKMVFTVPNLFVFFNKYGDNLPELRNILVEFENDFYQTSHKYFYVMESSANIMYNIQERGGLIEPLVSLFREEIVENAIQQGVQSMEIKFEGEESDGKGNDPVENLPYADPLHPEEFKAKVTSGWEVTTNQNGKIGEIRHPMKGTY